MDTQPALNPVTNALPSATQLLVGAPAAARTHAITYLQKQLCVHHGCTVCTSCINIAARNHYAITWIAPIERYTLENLEPLLHTIAFQLDHEQKHYIIIEQADALPPLCANALLKTIEEPPHGYHIILLAHSTDRIIATIRSRCLIKYVPGAHVEVEHPLIACFTQQSLPSPSTFIKLLEQNKLTEQENFALLDALLAKLLAIMREYYSHNQTFDATLAYRYTLVHHMCERPLMPGSAKIIWRELFLQWNNIQK